MWITELTSRQSLLEDICGVALVKNKNRKRERDGQTPPTFIPLQPDQSLHEVGVIIRIWHWKRKLNGTLFEAY